MSSTTNFCLGLSVMLLLNGVASSINYKTALTNSLLYYEAQRSGRLPPKQRVQWRGDSGLKDGSDAHMSLVGGYYDSGDNVKFGFPMAFTVTMLSWSVVEFQSQLAVKGELSHALDAIKWGTDYLIKAHRYPHVLYGEVGDGTSDHNCWERPEDMTTPRTTFRIDNQHPGADLAGETAAAFAAASMAFRRLNPRYASQLLIRAKQLFNFAHTHPGLYQNSIPVAGAFYSSSGYQDELLWAAAWLHRATSARNYLYYLGRSNNTGGTRSMFSWDDKYIGAQVLVAKLVLEGKVKNNGIWAEYKSEAEQFICSCIQKGNSNVQKTPGGMLWFQQPWNPLQYTSSATFILSAYADYLTAARTNLQCQHGLARPTDLITFARSQVNYILGANPKRTSYMVGFGSRYPQQVHHRGSSIVSIKKNRTVVTCNEGYALWYSRDAPNPNVLVGAVVGGPDQNDNYMDARTNYQQGEPSTVTTAPLVGVLARLA